MKIVAEFDGLKLREVDEQDYARLEEWIAADPAHASLFEPDFFLGREVTESGELAADPRATCYALEDGAGAIFFIRIERAARVYIQFAPQPERSATPLRTAKGLVKGMAFLEVGLARAGASEWVFETQNSSLKKLAETVLGFHSSKSEMIRPITHLPEPEKALHGEQQNPERGT